MLQNLNKLMESSKLMDNAILAVRAVIKEADFECPIMMERLNVLVDYAHNHDGIF